MPSDLQGVPTDPSSFAAAGFLSRYREPEVRVGACEVAVRPSSHRHPGRRGSGPEGPLDRELQWRVPTRCRRRERTVRSQ